MQKLCINLLKVEKEHLRYLDTLLSWSGIKFHIYFQNFGINNKKKKNVSFKPENQHLIIEDHEVCWDLQKRGAVGETALHLCYLIDSEVHLEVAKVLLQMFPKLALDIYEGLEYYGELPEVYNDL